MKKKCLSAQIIKRLNKKVFSSFFFCTKENPSKDQINESKKITIIQDENNNNPEKNVRYFKTLHFDLFSNVTKKYFLKINANENNKEKHFYFSKFKSLIKLLSIVFAGSYMIFMSMFEIKSWNNRYESRAKEIYLNSKNTTTDIKSLRNEEINLLIEYLKKLSDKKFEFIVVKGEKGIGKTTMIKTALEKVPGVIKTHSIEPGTTKDKILEKLYEEVCGNNRFFKPLDANRVNTQNIINAYNKLYEKEDNILYRKPIVVISVDERKTGMVYAQISSAARSITEMGCKVILDVSDDAYQNEPNLREIILDVDLMSKDQLLSIDEYKNIFDKCKDQELKELMFALLGGNPQYYNQISVYNYNENDENIKKFLLKISKKAYINYKMALSNINPIIAKQMIKKLKQNGKISSEEKYEWNKIDLKGFVRLKDEFYFTSNSAVDFFIRSGLSDVLLEDNSEIDDLPYLTYENLIKFLKQYK